MRAYVSQLVKLGRWRFETTYTPFHGRIALIIAIGLSVCCAMLALSVRAHNRSPVSSPLKRPTIENKPIDEFVAEPQVPDGETEAEVIIVHPYGFEPSEISRPRGPFLLAVHNHSRLDQMSMQLNRVTGSRVHEVVLPRGRMRWHTLFDLPPGQYLLTEADHPQWVCKITITPQ